MTRAELVGVEQAQLRAWRFANGNGGYRDLAVRAIRAIEEGFAVITAVRCSELDTVRTVGFGARFALAIVEPITFIRVSLLGFPFAPSANTLAVFDKVLSGLGVGERVAAGVLGLFGVALGPLDGGRAGIFGFGEFLGKWHFASRIP